jgi:hypothetical protein
LLVTTVAFLNAYGYQLVYPKISVLGKIASLAGSRYNASDRYIPEINDVFSTMFMLL